MYPSPLLVKDRVKIQDCFVLGINSKTGITVEKMRGAYNFVRYMKFRLQHFAFYKTRVKSIQVKSWAVEANKG